MVPGTVREEITLFDPAITEAQVHAAAELTGLKEAIENLENGYDTVCTPELFSQGQWQLLSIARAVAARPSILLLDEITANLDVGTEYFLYLFRHRKTPGVHFTFNEKNCKKILTWSELQGV